MKKPHFVTDLPAVIKSKKPVLEHSVHHAAVWMTVGEFVIAITLVYLHGDMLPLYLAVTYFAREKAGMSWTKQVFFKIREREVTESENKAA